MVRTPRLSLSVKVGLVLFAVVAGALAIVYLAVMPQLESRLVDAKIEELETTVAPTAARSIEGTPLELLELRGLAQLFDVRVVVYSKLTDTSLLSQADSHSDVPAADVQGDPIALEALMTGAQASGRTTRGGSEFAEVAVPVGNDRVVLVSAPLADALANVRLVRRSLIAAGVASLAISWLVGYLIAWRFTRRIRRLEGAAERLAAGDFETPVVDEGRDEVGQLAAAFDSMRVRLAALDRARSEFIANASHELRTPLFSLGGFLELLDDEGLDDATRRDFLVEMRGQIDRLTRLATDLLDLSRLDAGQLEVERRPVDLRESARVVCEEFRPTAEAGGRSLRADGEEPVAALGDEQRVQQIGRILVENALRHTPLGTRVELRAGKRDGRAFLEVQDDGAGVPEEDREHLFERFYRAGGGKASGSGLGLAIASELASRMDGGIELRSEPGETVFTLVLPLADRDIPRENAPEEAELARAGDSTPA
jgi:two-component system, OmpR family, sensor kinase